MRYYVLKENARRKNLGVYPQIIKYLHNCNVRTDEKFIDKFFLKRLPKNCITSDIRLHEKSFLTHFLVPSGSIGFKGALICNRQVVDLWSSYKIKDIEFQEIRAFQENSIHSYFVTHPYNLDYSMIDFEKSEFITIQRDYPPKSKKIKVRDVHDFHMKREEFNGLVNNTVFQMSKFYLHTKFQHYDVFVMDKMGSGLNYLVSERLKVAMDNHGVTSINYRPSDISANKWSADPKVRFERYGTK